MADSAIGPPSNLKQLLRKLLLSGQSWPGSTDRGESLFRDARPGYPAARISSIRARTRVRWSSFASIAASASVRRPSATRPAVR